MLGDNFATWYNASQGTLFVQADSTVPVFPQSYVAASVNDASAANRISIYNYNGFWGGIVRVSSVTQADLAQGSSYTVNVPAKIAFAYKQDDFAASVNGNAALIDTSGTIPSVTRMDLGATAYQNPINGHIRSISYYPTRLANATLQSITS